MDAVAAAEKELEAVTARHQPSAAHLATARQQMIALMEAVPEAVSSLPVLPEDLPDTELSQALLAVAEELRQQEERREERSRMKLRKPLSGTASVTSLLGLA
jgi:hypothetical protein